MRKIGLIVAGLAILLVIVLTSVESRREKGPPAYNAAAEVTLTGEVQETREFFCPLSDEQGMHLVLRTSQGNVLVHVGPARFLRSQEVRINPHDQVSVIGNRVNYQGQDAFLVREITRGNDVMILRDQQGRPVWNR